MKPKLLLMLIALLFTCPIFGQTNPTKRVAILETVDKEGKISYGIKLMIRSQLSAAITNTPGYEAYDRVDISSIMAEHNFQRTGLVSDSDIKRLGEMTGAEFVLIVEVAQIDNTHLFISSKLIEIETLRIEQTANIQTANTNEQLETSCHELARKLLNIKINSRGKVEVEIMLENARYVGEYSNGIPNGKGTAYFKNGDIYKGDWINGKREGQGKLTYANGDVYEGGFINDVKNGAGIFVYSDGTKKVGRWHNDTFQDDDYYTVYFPQGSHTTYHELKGSRRKVASFDESGRLVSSCTFNNGHLEKGVTYFFHSNGKISIVNDFKNGKLITSTFYDEKGHKISTEEY